ncbi:MAG TPA: molybdate ABC transporter substrate-binding protein [Mycobacteriales bacterium]|nr:molybdate ABC transporter substrate-binding protein [Mycobacteriales bacterium]
MKRLLGTAAAVAALALVAGCGDNASDSASGSGSAAPSASSSGSVVTGTITVFAAASLTESFGTVGKQFEAAHPGTTVKFNFGASSALAQSIIQGAPADVFASASAKNMTQIGDEATGSTTFANNVMEIAVPPDNPGKVTQVSDLTKAGLKVALCQAQVPCGATAKQVFDKQKLTVKPVTEGADVKSVLTAVQLGEVDAGVVYKTDVQAAGAKVKGIEIPDAQNASTSYPIASLKAAPNSAGAAAFVDYVLSADGEKVLADAGFAGP